jgi:hypothetical protein
VVAGVRSIRAMHSFKERDARQLLHVRLARQHIDSLWGRESGNSLQRADDDPPKRFPVSGQAEAAAALGWEDTSHSKLAKVR